MSPQQDYLKATQVNAFTRGSQIFMHSPAHVHSGLLKASCMVSAILTGSFVLLRCKIMQDLSLRAIYPKVNTSVRNHKEAVEPYLLKGLDICKPNQVW